MAPGAAAGWSGRARPPRRAGSCSAPARGRARRRAASRTAVEQVVDGGVGRHARTCSSSTPAAARAAAKYRTVTVVVVTSCILAQPPIALIGRSGCRKPGSSMPCPASLPHIACAPGVGDLGVGAAAAQHRPQVGLGAGEQARADLAVGGEPGAVAGAAERPGDRGDHADHGRAAVDQPALGGGAAALGRVRGERRSAARSVCRISPGGDHLGALPAVLGVQRHLLDEAQLVAVVHGEPQQRRRPRRRSRRAAAPC